MKSSLLAGALALAFTGAAFAQAGPTQGVSKNEIVLGSLQDLSGPIAAFGKQVRYGMDMRVAEANEAGGIHGRKIKLVTEDMGYDPKKALLGAQKLIGRDKVFALLGTLGSSTSLAVMPEAFKANVPHLFPVAAAREMYEPLHPLKYSFAATYYEQIRAGVKHMVKMKNSKKVCTLYQDDDFGIEVQRGAEAGLKEINMQLAERTSYKRGATDFSSQVAKLKSSGCDLVILGTIIRETIGAIGEARKSGYNPDFLGSSAVYTDLIHKLGPKFTDGLYGMMTVAHPYPDDASKNVRAWTEKYKAAFKEDATVFSVYGYVIVDTVLKTIEKTGPNLTVQSFINTLDSSTFSRDMFGSSEMSYTKTKHLGSNSARMSQIVNGKWTPVSDYITQ